MNDQLIKVLMYHLGDEVCIKKVIRLLLISVHW